MHPQLSVLGRLILAFSLMTLLVLAASAVGLWFADSAIDNFKAHRQAIDQINRVRGLQSSWLTMAGILDTISVTRASAGETQEQLTQQVEEFNSQLALIDGEPLGLSPETIVENKKIAQDLQQLGDEIGSLVIQINDLVEQRRWDTAMQIRHSKMVDMQRRLSTNLNQLNQNIQKDIAKQSVEAERTQRLAIIYSIVVILTTLVFFGILIWIFQRGIQQPIRHIIGIVHRLMKGDFSPVTPLKQRDEIGDLSRAFAQMTDWLRESFEELEHRIIDRTNELEHRNLQVQVAAQVAHDITTTRDLETLLQQAVELILTRFSLYFVSIFLTDEQQEYVVLRASAGQAGQGLLRDYKMKIGQAGMVPYAAFSGQPRVALDTEADNIYFKHPLLAETRSEVALPLKIGAQVIGVLDLQSRESSTFDKDTVTILQVMADQLAVAIQNTRLVGELRENLHELESLYGLYGRQTWDKITQTAPVIGYQYDRVSLTPISPGRSPKLRSDGYSSSASSDIDGKPVSVPLQVRGTVIGRLNVWPEAGTLSSDEFRLLGTISNRLGQNLENARLLEDTQRRAANERLISEITASMRTSMDMDTVLRTALCEIAEKLNIAQVEVHLGTSPGPHPAAPIQQKMTD